MATSPNLLFPSEKINPRAVKKRRRCEIADEIRAVDAAIAALDVGTPMVPVFGSAVPIGILARAVSLRSLKHYRQRLVRAAR